ncbi:MAG TPA: hypothetical protein VFE51_20795 [Verrucomicrobiae bacterium]|nr:hypothetical protein [Verrucomicrobiae bacterium]
MNERYRADLPAWIFIGGLSCLPWLIVWFDWWRKIDLTALAFAIGSSGLAFAWLFSFRIALTSSEVRFRSLFRGQQSIRHDQIQRVRLTWSLRRGLRGPLRLVIEPRTGSAFRELDINAKVFSRAAIKAVLDLGTRVAESDDGGLRDGVVVKGLRKWKRPHNV